MSRRDTSLGSAICDAADMAQMTVKFLGQGLHVEDAAPPQLVAGETSLLMLAVSETTNKADRVKALYYATSETRVPE